MLMMKIAKNSLVVILSLSSMVFADQSDRDVVIIPPTKDNRVHVIHLPKNKFFIQRAKRKEGESFLFQTQMFEIEKRLANSKKSDQIKDKIKEHLNAFLETNRIKPDEKKQIDLLSYFDTLETIFGCGETDRAEVCDATWYYRSPKNVSEKVEMPKCLLEPMKDKDSDCYQLQALYRLKVYSNNTNATAIHQTMEEQLQ